MLRARSLSSHYPPSAMATMGYIAIATVCAEEVGESPWDEINQAKEHDTKVVYN